MAPRGAVLLLLLSLNGISVGGKSLHRLRIIRLLALLSCSLFAGH